jgi:tetratricopeptide (TPR) repeat protein
LTVLVLLAASCLILGGAVLRNRPVRAYVSGYRAYQTGNQLQEVDKVQEAHRSFKRAIEEMAPVVAAGSAYDHQDVIHCMLFTGLSCEKLGEPEKAEDLYATILKEYPYSRYAGECYVKIARLKKAGRDPALEEALMALGHGDQAHGFLLIEKALDQTELSLAFLQRAIAEDPYSEWAKYARQDMDAERQYLEEKLLLLRSLGGHPDLEQSLSRICHELHP